MKITNDLPPELDPRKNGVDKASKTSRAHAVQGPSKVSGESGDSVSISSRGKFLSELASRTDASPVAESPKLSAILQAVAEGRYAFGPEVVADRLMRSLANNPAGI